MPKTGDRPRKNALYASDFVYYYRNFSSGPIVYLEIGLFTRDFQNWGAVSFFGCAVIWGQKRRLRVEIEGDEERVRGAIHWIYLDLHV